MSAELVARIRLRCIECGDCLLWQGCMSGAGKSQPQIGVGKKRLNVRRIMWEHAHGQAAGSRGISVDCGNVRCVKHLVATTVQQRVRKASAEGKYSTLRRKAKIAGTRRAQSGIDPQKVHDIRYGGGTGREAAERNGVSESTASAIRTGKRWADYASPFAGLMA